MQPIDLNRSLVRTVHRSAVTLFGILYHADFLAAHEGLSVTAEYHVDALIPVRIFSGEPLQFLGVVQPQVHQDLKRRLEQDAGTVTDTCNCDVLVQQGDGQSYRPTLTVTADVASGAILGYQIGAAHAVPLAYRPVGNPRAKSLVENFFRDFARSLPPSKRPLTLRELTARSKAFFASRNNNIFKRAG